MISIGRDQDNTPDRLRLFLVDNSGASSDPISVQFRIYDSTSGTPIQAFPSSGSENVLVNGRFDTGAFYAFDSTRGSGWSPGSSATLGDWLIEWSVTPSAGAPFVRSEKFRVVEFGTQAEPDPLYVSVAEVRAAGLPDVLTPSKIESELRTWQSWIVRVCRQWFHPQWLQLELDGDDSEAIHFGVPIVLIDELRVNGSSQPLDIASYRVYATARYPDNRANPRICLTGGSSGLFGCATPRFVFGRQNQFVKGVFGCVEPDGSTPPLIQRALLKLVIEKLSTPVYGSIPGVEPPAAIAGLIVEEWTDGHKLKYAESNAAQVARAPGLSGITADQEILTILKQYKAPIGVATPR